MAGFKYRAIIHRTASSDSTNPDLDGVTTQGISAVRPARATLTPQISRPINYRANTYLGLQGLELLLQSVALFRLCLAQVLQHFRLCLLLGTQPLPRGEAASAPFCICMRPARKVLVRGDVREKHLRGMEKPTGGEKILGWIRTEPGDTRQKHACTTNDASPKHIPSAVDAASFSWPSSGNGSRCDPIASDGGRWSAYSTDPDMEDDSVAASDAA